MSSREPPSLSALCPSLLLLLLTFTASPEESEPQNDKGPLVSFAPIATVLLGCWGIPCRMMGVLPFAQWCLHPSFELNTQTGN